MVLLYKIMQGGVKNLGKYYEIYVRSLLDILEFPSSLSISISIFLQVLKQ